MEHIPGQVEVWEESVVIPTYGVGKDRTRRFWKYLIDALTRQGLAAIEGEEYPYLRVTETGWETLRGAPFRALRIVETRARRNRAERDGASQDMDVDDTLFQLLRAAGWRKPRRCRRMWCSMTVPCGKWRRESRPAARPCSASPGSGKGSWRNTATPSLP